jgi:hypothetical protein
MATIIENGPGEFKGTVEGGQRTHPAEDLLADDQIGRVRLRILDPRRLVAGLLDRLLQFRSKSRPTSMFRFSWRSSPGRKGVFCFMQRS